MAIRFIPSLPRGGVVWNEDTSRNISARNHDAYVMQNNLSFMTGPVTGNDGTVYTWVEDNKKRTGFVNDSGYSSGNPSADTDEQRFIMYDKVGAAGSYIIKLGHGTTVNHRWLRGVVGFDARFKLEASSTASTNDPWVGKIGMIYRNTLNNAEYIYRPTVSFNGPTGDITKGSYVRVARKFVHNGGPHQDIHDLDLLFTGLIFEYGHGKGGGAVETKIYLRIKDFKPIFSNGKDKPTQQLGFSEFESYELLPRMRPWSDRDKIEFDTNNPISS